MKRGTILLLILILLLLVFRGAPPPTIFEEPPIATAHWEIYSDENYLGYPIKASIIAANSPGATLNISDLPNTGEMLKLRDGFHELEVISRQTTTELRLGRVITTIKFELLYLEPPDLTNEVDLKWLPDRLPLYQEYWLYQDGQAQFQQDRIAVVESAALILNHRINENSVPHLNTIEPEKTPTPWPMLKLLGYALISLGLCLIISLLIKKIRPAKKPINLGYTVPLPSILDLYQAWQQSGNDHYFWTAVRLFRKRAWNQAPSCNNLARTTYLIYSGKKFSEWQMEIAFKKLIQEIHNES